MPDPTNLFDYNRYMYVRGNPLKYNDPTGHYLETGLDLISLGMTIQDINDNGLGWQNGIGLAADVVSLAAPGVAGGGTAVRYADEAYAAGKAGVNAAWDWGKGLLGYGDEAADAGGDLARQADNVPGNPCVLRNSFSADTPVMTASGLKPISELVEGDLVLAYNEATGEIGVYPITDTISHVDPEIVLVTIDGETLETTAEHPFYELESAPWLVAGEQQGRWTDALDLQVGDQIWQADGTTGTVQAVTVVPVQQRMYNLSVETAHTFFVGQQQWLVHNCDDIVKIVEQDNDIVEILAKGANGNITIVTQMQKQGDQLILTGMHVDGPGAGTSSISELMNFAKELGKQQGVKEVVINGARRTTGANPGRIPRPIIVKVD